MRRLGARSLQSVCFISATKTISAKPATKIPMKVNLEEQIKEWARQELKEVFESWPMDYATDAEYTDKEIIEIQSNLIKKMYSDIEALVYPKCKCGLPLGHDFDHKDNPPTE